MSLNQTAPKAPTENALRLNSQYIGKKYGHLTILELDGAHPNSGAVLVKVRCDCGTEIGGLLRSDVTRGARVCCSKQNCPVYLREKQRQRSDAVSKPKRERVGSRATRPRSVESSAGIESSTSQASLNTFRVELETLAIGLRKAAVSLVKGKADPAQIAAALRVEADKIDEHIYA